MSVRAISSTLQLLIVMVSLCRASEEDRTQQLERRLNINIVVLSEDSTVQLGSGRITAIRATGDCGRYVQRLVEEFSLYPPELIRAVSLKKIVVCESLAFNGQRRSAIPDFENNILYYDYQSGRKHPRYQRAVMHHEFFHLIDFHDDGIVYRDNTWAKLNPPGFSYGRGGVSVQSDATQSEFRKPTDGFLTRYSVAGVEEDKAELFAHLIVNPMVVKDRVRSDAILDSKVSNLKARMKAFCPALDDTFWARIARFRN